MCLILIHITIWIKRNEIQQLEQFSINENKVQGKIIYEVGVRYIG
jgi:hypothetical protein